jgi:hypothetical protein
MAAVVFLALQETRDTQAIVMHEEVSYPRELARQRA